MPGFVLYYVEFVLSVIVVESCCCINRVWRLTVTEMMVSGLLVASVEKRLHKPATSKPTSDYTQVGNFSNDVDIMSKAQEKIYCEFIQ